MDRKEPVAALLTAFSSIHSIIGEAIEEAMNCPDRPDIVVFTLKETRSHLKALDALLDCLNSAYEP